VFCFPVFPGNFGTERDKENKRLGMVSCYDAGGKEGLWGRPIAGLLAVIDYDDQKLVNLIDTGVVPIPEGGPSIAADLPNAMQPMGPEQQRFSITDSWIEWDKWRFHLRIDPRVGPVLSQASIKYGDERRSVLYHGSVSEMFVPYMDPTRNWYFRTYLDVGEYNIGTSGVPLRHGIDCPADAEMISANFMNERGTTYGKKDVACVFERETGDPAWSHYEMASDTLNRRHTELVVRFVVWLGNYDYVVDWIFSETGSIKGRVGATGIVQIKGVNSQTMAAETATSDTRFGRLIAPGTVAVNHDHFFNFRLDLDVDGSDNRMIVDRLRRVDLDATDFNTPRRQIWQIFPEILKQESDAKLSVDTNNPALWRVSNPRVTNRVGNPVSYQLHPGVTARTLLDDDEIAHRRASFTDHHLWVTPYAANERYAAGDYPNQHPGGAGLPEWTTANRSIEDTDLVLWYTIGMHHVVRAEDWPIMPTIHNEFELRPFDFFDYNPTVTE
jgi:primary-amine oxidase